MIRIQFSICQRYCIVLQLLYNVFGTSRYYYIIELVLEVRSVILSVFISTYPVSNSDSVRIREVAEPCSPWTVVSELSHVVLIAHTIISCV